MIVPIGNSAAIRRLPYITFSIILLNFAIFFISSSIYYNQEKVIYQYYSDYITALNDFLLENSPEIENDAEKYTEIVESPETDEMVIKSTNVMSKYEAYKKELQNHVFYRFGLSKTNNSPFVYISYQFIHSGILHLIGNMWFLLLLGMNIEDIYGRMNYLVFYLAAGVISGWSFLLSSPAGSTVPLVGASGAISGVMGIFFYRFFKEKIRFFYFVLPVKPLFGTFSLYAGIFLPLWFAQQLFDASSDGQSPVAFISHITGFLFGIATAFILTYFKIEEKYIKPKIDESANLIGISASEQKGIEYYYSGKYSESADILSSSFYDLPKEDTFKPLFFSQIKSGKKQDAEKTADIMLDSMQTGKCKCSAEEMYNDVSSGGVIDGLSFRAKFILAKLLIEEKNIDKARFLLKDVAENDKFSILGYKSILLAVTEKIYFDGIKDIIDLYDREKNAETEHIMENVLRSFNEQE